MYDNDPVPLLAKNPEIADYAQRVATAADDAARSEPLLAPQRAQEALDNVPRPDGVSPLPAQRLLRLATAASKTAALSSRLEIYPRGMPASLALRQSVGALAGPKFLRSEDVIDRVRGRYPEAESLSSHPILDSLLVEAGGGLVWSDTGANGAGYYATLKGPGPSAGTTTYYVRHGTVDEQPVEFSAEIAEARQFEERLEYARKSGGFLALTVSTRLARHAEAELLKRFGFDRVSFDALFIGALREQARAVKADWNVVLRADASTAGSRDWTNLMRLVQKTAPVVAQQLALATTPTLLVHPGLLARYQVMGIIEELRDRAGRSGAVPSLWLLVPMATNGLPAVDGVPVPVISSAQWARIPQAWIENQHRSGTNPIGITSSVGS